MKSTQFSIKQNFSPEIRTASGQLWDNYKHARSDKLKATSAFPTKLVVKGQAVWDLFPMWGAWAKSSTPTPHNDRATSQEPPRSGAPMQVAMADLLGAAPFKPHNNLVNPNNAPNMPLCPIMALIPWPQCPTAGTPVIHPGKSGRPRNSSRRSRATQARQATTRRQRTPASWEAQRTGICCNFIGNACHNSTTIGWIRSLQTSNITMECPRANGLQNIGSLIFRPDQQIWYRLCLWNVVFWPVQHRFTRIQWICHAPN